jgi:phosphoribosylglycinamide formyltransferase-1
LKPLRLAVLISGRGSNLQALIDACKSPAYPADIAVVISNTPDAQGLERAANAGIPAMIVDHTYFKKDKTAFETTLANIAEQHNANFVALAGFMRILGPTFLKRFKDKVVNIHPSLLPKHKGLDVHESVLKSGDAVSGCSVHVVTEGMDEGPVIAQREVPVKPGDSANDLAARILVEEHRLYPEVIQKIANGDVVIRNGRIETKGDVSHHKPIKKEPEKPSMSHDHAPAHTPVADPAEIQRSQDMWHAFTHASMIAGGAIAVVLILMATFLA